MSLFTGRHLNLVAAIAMAIATCAYAVWRYVDGNIPGPDLFRLYGIVMAILVISWIVSDPAIPSACRPSFDHGMLIWMSFPFLAVYYMYLAHRWRGLSIVIGLFGLFVAPDLAFVIVRIVV